MSKHSHIPLVTQNIIAYSNFLYFKEYMGIERAEGIAILSQKNLSRININRLIELIAMEDENKKKFLQYTSENIKNKYNQLIKNDIYKELQKIRTTMLLRDIDKLNIDSKDWYILMSKNINLLSVICSDIRDEISINIKLELNHVNNIFMFLSGITVLSIVVFFMMLVAFFILAKNEQRLRVVMDKYIISSTTDLKGKIIDVSEAFCKISGFSRKELIGKNHNIVRHPDMSKEVFRDLWAKIVRGEPWRGKVKNIRKNGSFYWVYANIEPLFNTNGIIDSYISIRLDITESEELTKKIRNHSEPQDLNGIKIA
jgi:PAS domain S-box-containing protein